jgi:hypothetical protein
MQEDEVSQARLNVCCDHTFGSRYLALCMSCMVNVFICSCLMTLNAGLTSSILAH